MPKTETYSDPWDALEDDPGKRAVLKLKSALMMDIRRELVAATRAPAVPSLEESWAAYQKTMKYIQEGRMAKLSLEELICFAVSIGLDMDRLITVRKHPATEAAKAALKETLS